MSAVSISTRLAPAAVPRNSGLICNRSSATPKPDGYKEITNVAVRAGNGDIDAISCVGIHSALRPEPELRAVAEQARQAQSHLRSDGTTLAPAQDAGLHALVGKAYLLPLDHLGASAERASPRLTADSVPGACLRWVRGSAMRPQGQVCQAADARATAVIHNASSPMR